MPFREIENIVEESSPSQVLNVRLKWFFDMLKRELNRYYKSGAKSFPALKYLPPTSPLESYVAGISFPNLQVRKHPK